VNLIPKAREYLQKFVQSNLPDYLEIKREYRPNNGYGHFHRSDEIYQTMLDIYYNLDDNFSDLSIPERHPSPKALVQKIEWFIKLLRSRQDLVDEVAKQHQSQRLHLPVPLVEIDRVRREVIAAFEYALSIAQSELDTSTQKQDTKKPTSNLPVPWYKRGGNQAAIIGGLFVLGAAIFTVVAPKWFESESENSVKQRPLQPDSISISSPKPQTTSSETARDKLRHESGLRALLPAESNLSIEEMPKGVFGFTHSSTIRYLDGDIRRYPNGTFDFEIHKLPTGETFAVGFTNPDAATELRKESQPDTLRLTLYSETWQSASELVRIPLPRIVEGTRIRQVDIDKLTVVNAADMKVKPTVAGRRKATKN
jgi:hypothetical protein